jgi:hypothetical protein
MVVLWVMILCVLLEDYRRSGSICCLHMIGIVVCAGYKTMPKACSFLDLIL